MLSTVSQATTYALSRQVKAPVSILSSETFQHLNPCAESTCGTRSRFHICLQHIRHGIKAAKDPKSATYCIPCKQYITKRIDLQLQTSGLQHPRPKALKAPACRDMDLRSEPCAAPGKTDSQKASETSGAGLPCEPSVHFLNGYTAMKLYTLVKRVETVEVDRISGTVPARSREECCMFDV